MSINVEKLMGSVRDDIAQNGGYEPGDKDAMEAISAMDFDEAFGRWCEWNGFLGSWSETIAAAYENIKSAERNANRRTKVSATISTGG